MNDKVQRQESKEFQLKINLDRLLKKSRRTPGPTDELLFATVCQTLAEILPQLGNPRKSTLQLNNNLWQREGVRFDTADRLLRANNLTLALEATDAMTKLKCKQHHFIPEMLFEKPKQAISFPDIRVAGKYKKHEATLKLEQDLHFNNIKSCASGSLYVKGRQTAAESLGTFSRYFPGLNAVARANTPLVEVAHWDEAIFDDMSIGWDRLEVGNWMLVNRWDSKTKALLESELSFKVVKSMDDPWNTRALRESSRLYLALQKTGVFQLHPPIFTFDNPVSSIDIMKVETSPATATKKR